MKKFELNNVALIYFGVSWLIGAVIILLSLLRIQIDFVYTLLFLSAFNLIVNLFSIVILFVFYYVFPENKTEFKNSAILLFFNFPILFVLYIIILMS